MNLPTNQNLGRCKLCLLFCLLLSIGCNYLWISNEFHETLKPSTSNRFFVHKVKYQGETLNIIALWRTKRSANWKQILASNPNVKANRLRIGDRLLIPEILVVNREELSKEFISKYAKSTSAFSENASEPELLPTPEVASSPLPSNPEVSPLAEEDISTPSLPQLSTTPSLLPANSPSPSPSPSPENEYILRRRKLEDQLKKLFGDDDPNKESEIATNEHEELNSPSAISSPWIGRRKEFVRKKKKEEILYDLTIDSEQAANPRQLKRN